MGVSSAADSGMRVETLFAHHGTHQLDRCIKVGATHVCARCAGMYPAMALGAWLTLSGAAGPGGTAELVLRYALSALGVAAWGVDRLRPLGFRRANVARVALGAALGLGLGLMLGRHVVEPFRPDVVRQIVLVTILGAAFLAIDLLRGRTVRKGRDREETSSQGAGAP
jgi:hypothetical protein